MNKSMLSFFMIVLLFLSGCGNSSQLAKPVKIEDCSIFTNSDIVSNNITEFGAECEWKNDHAKARITGSYNLDGGYLSYKSDLIECEELSINYQVNKADLSSFYEEDIDNDGKKEFCISIVKGTGTGEYDGKMLIYKVKDDKSIDSTPINDYDYKTIDKKSLLNLIEEWNVKATETNRVDINTFSDTLTSVYKPEIVKVDGKCMMRAEIVLVEKKQRNNAEAVKNGKTLYFKDNIFYCLYEYENGQYKLKSIYEKE